MTTVLGSLTPATSPNSTMAIMVAKPSVADATKRDVGLVASTAFASAAALAAATAQEVLDRNAAITAAVAGLGSGGGASSFVGVADATYTASGAIDPAKKFVLLNASGNLAMTLAAAAATRDVLWIVNVGSGTATVAGTIDDASATFTVGSKVTLALAWIAARSSWKVIGQYDPGVLITDLPAATLASTTLIPAFDADGTAKKTTGAALATFFGGGSGGSAPAAATFTPYPATPTGAVGTSDTYARGDHAHPAAAKVFNASITQPGVTADAQRLLVYKTNDVLTLPAGLAGSSGTALVAATASAAFVLAYIRGGVTTAIATFTFAAGGTVATISGVTIPTFAVGDVLILTGPATADATLADIGFSIVGTRA